MEMMKKSLIALTSTVMTLSVAAVPDLQKKQIQFLWKLEAVKQLLKQQRNQKKRQ